MEEESKQMISDKRPIDVQVSTLVGKFLDENFYTENSITNFKRVYDKARQVIGIDTIFTYNNKTFYCDEKCTAQHRGIKSFTLELSGYDKKGKKIVEGWLTNDNNKNNSYILVWLNNHDIDVALVEKETILNYLNSLHLTKDKLREIAKKIRENDVEYLNKLGPIVKNEKNTTIGDYRKNGYCFLLSTPENLAETPINIKLPKEKYEEFNVLKEMKTYKTELFNRNFYNKKTAG